MSEDVTSAGPKPNKERSLKIALSDKLGLEAGVKQPDLVMLGPEGAFAIEIKVKAQGEDVGGVEVRKDQASNASWKVVSGFVGPQAKSKSSYELANIFAGAKWSNAADELKGREEAGEASPVASGLLYYVQVGANVKSYVSALQGGAYSLSLAELTADFLRGDFTAARKIRSMYRASRVKTTTADRNADLDDGPCKTVRAGVGAAKVRALAS